MARDKLELSAVTATPAVAAVPDRPAPSLLSGLVRTARPKQWIKNVLVFAAPGAAGVLDNATPFVQTCIAFVAFCLAASGTYFLNDVADIEADRRHPIKRSRPVAAGVVPVNVARLTGIVLLLGGIGISFAARWELAATVAAYVVLTTLYSAGLKHVAVVDIVLVASGFVMRAVAGATATGVPVSDWFFIVASFGSLFMVTGKRGAEVGELGEDASSIRPTLASYSQSYLAYLRTVSSGTVVVAYTLWAFEKAAGSEASIPWFQLTILPFVLGVLRYALLLDQGRGSAPEELVLGDLPLLLTLGVWAVVFACGIYLA